MWSAIVALLSSRKFVLTLLGLVAAGAARLGFNWSAEAMAVAVSPFIAAILGVAHEDAAAKSAGANTTQRTSVEQSATGTPTVIVETDAPGTR